MHFTRMVHRFSTIFLLFSSNIVGFDQFVSLRAIFFFSTKNKLVDDKKLVVNSFSIETNNISRKKKIDRKETNDNELD